MRHKTDVLERSLKKAFNGSKNWRILYMILKIIINDTETKQLPILNALQDEN